MENPGPLRGESGCPISSDLAYLDSLGVIYEQPSRLEKIHLSWLEKAYNQDL